MAENSKPFELLERAFNLRKRAGRAGDEAALGRVLDLLRLIFGAVGFGTWVYDTRAQWLGWDAKTLEVFGISAAEFGNEFRDLETRIHPEDRAPALSALDAFLNEDEAEPYVFRILRPDGSERWLQWWTLSHRDEGGDLLAMFGVIRDITEERERDARIFGMQRHRALGQLTAGVAHDFNNLLSVIENSAEVALEAVSRAEDPRRDLALIRGAAQRGTSLTAQLLAFGRQTELSPAEVPVGSFVRDLNAMLDRLLPDNILLRYRIEADVPSIVVDRNQLETATLTLALNARDAMPDGGLLTLDLACETLEEGFFEPSETHMRPGRHAVLSMSDSGHGMFADTLDRAPQPHFSTKPRVHHAGMGLPAVLGFVQQSGGTIRIESEPGFGTIVRMFFPTEVFSKPPAAPCTIVSPEIKTREGCILLVEDDRALRQLLQRRLVTAGFQVRAMATGDEAIKALSEGLQPDLILTDMSLPGTLQGDALIRKVRDAYPGVPALLVTGFPPDDSVAREVTLLRKPVPFPALIREIDMALAQGPAY